MKYIFCILLLLNSSSAMNSERLTIASATSSQGELYSLIQVLDEDGGCLFVEVEAKGSTQLLGGDTTPFPLSKYGIKDSIAKKLVAQFVKYEIANTKGGVQALQNRLQERDHLPNDLLEEYLKHMQLDAKPFYVKLDDSLKETLRVMEELQSKNRKDDLDAWIAKELRPVRGTLLEAISKLENEHLLELVLKSAIKFSKNEEIQLSIGVYIGRQAKHFRANFLKRDVEDQKKLKEAVKRAIDSNVIGGQVKEAATIAIKGL